MASARTLAFLEGRELPGPPGYDPMWDEIVPPHREEVASKFGFAPQPLWYDREGEPLTMRQWVALWEEFTDYRKIAFTEIGPYHVSTIWTGIDHSFGRFPDGVPVIFESMVFSNEVSWAKERETSFGKVGGYHYHEDFDQRRYRTEAEARAGHAEIVNEIETIMRAVGDIDPRVLGE